MVKTNLQRNISKAGQTSAPEHDNVDRDRIIAASGSSNCMKLSLCSRLHMKGNTYLCPVSNDSPVLLRGARQEARDIDERQQRDVEGVAETHESSRLVCVDRVRVSRTSVHAKGR